MSDHGIDEAVEKILADPTYARYVLENPEKALTSDFDLEPGEWRSIHWSLKQDIEDSARQARYAQLPQLTGYRHLAQLPRLKGNIDRAGGEPTAHGRLVR